MTNKTKICLFFLAVAIIAAFVYRSQLESFTDMVRGITPQERANQSLFNLKNTLPKNASNTNDIATQAIGLARIASVATSTVEIRSCVTSPSILKVKFGTNFTINNEGDSVSSISFPSFKDNIAPHTSLLIKLLKTRIILS